ncbi:hypothetical protein M427DRAFT_71726 [Gonapodya prolifera JEL478]|uniref:Uncharacterized protein n=1 Tax=Gonapodya prolifera (strain JEL478) TaxID=1344416 RepID=A0A139A931_GONPJ|nr:hypothetical protein M427DRAFT_71726 [Gonapodya prolifera JEL478]|eukprot:KXS12975.1 hypothetical protein M427DRAFT_71726 [Gonapodya prolifera JEL478]
MTATSAASRLDDSLLEAVEARSLWGVRSALEGGADPNARKSVTLTMTLNNGETRHDTRQAESVLALAIEQGLVEIVQAILEKGGNPHLPISWPIANWIVWDVKWRAETWDQDRWRDHDHHRVQFPDALSFALAAGPTDMNPSGARVKMVNPKRHEHTSRFVILEPRREVVATVLRGGAIVSPSALTLALNLAQGVGCWDDDVRPEPEFLHMLQDHMGRTSVSVSASEPRSPTSPTSPTLSRGSAPAAEDPSVISFIAHTLSERLRISEVDAEVEEESLTFAKIKGQEVARVLHTGTSTSTGGGSPQRGHDSEAKIESLKRDLEEERAHMKALEEELRALRMAMGKSAT